MTGSSGGGGQRTQVVEQRTSTDLPAWQSSGLQRIAGEASTALEDPYRFYPGQTYTNLPPETLAGLEGATQQAAGPQPLLGGAAQYGTDVLGGQYLNSNPYADDLVDAASSSLTRNYREAVAPSIQAQFEMAGRSGSPASGDALARSQGELLDQLSDLEAQIRAPMYQQERGLQQQAAQFAPGLAAAQYQPYQQLMGVGQVRQGQAEAELQDAMQRFNFEQQEPINRLGQELAFYQGNYGGTSTSAQPYFYNPYQQGVGGALGLGGLGYQVAGPVGGGIGALLGGLGGFF